jgi:hypothetical protein
LHALAIRSAATHGGFEAVKLHHTDPIEAAPHVDALGDLSNVHFVALDDLGLCEDVSGPALAGLCGALQSPVARSNLVRTALVARDGGVYLDMDTLTIRSFDAVRAEAPAFLGEELIVFPREVVESWDPRVKARAYLKTTIRDLLRRLPHGYRYFPKIAHRYHRAVNGAIMGGVAAHPFHRAYLDAMTEVPRARWNRPHALGTHLLQATYAAYQGRDLHAFPPPVFYPLPPEISAHWFRCYPHGVDADEVLEPTTCCVHWYASVRTKKVVATMDDDASIRSNADTQLFSALARRVLDEETFPREMS